MNWSALATNSWVITIGGGLTVVGVSAAFKAGRQFWRKFWFCIRSDSTKLLRLEEENIRLARENRELKEALAQKQQGKTHDSAAWKVLEDGTEEGPYCPNCYEKTGLFIQPVLVSNNGSIVRLSCTSCVEDEKQEFTFRVPSRLAKQYPVSKPVPPPRRPRWP